MVWQKGQDVLSAKSIMVTADPRIKLVNHHNLQIRSIKLSDAGDYQCKIHVLGDPIVVIHTLEILGKLTLFFHKSLIPFICFHIKCLFVLQSDIGNLIFNLWNDDIILNIHSSFLRQSQEHLKS